MYYQTVIKRRNKFRGFVVSTMETRRNDDGAVHDKKRLPEWQFFPTSEGYYDYLHKRYVYHYTDHLGNVRLSYYRSNNGNLTIDKESNYYPFGLEHTGYNGLLGNQSYNYKYNSKELQTEIGMYDYGARFYMPDLGRWGVVDNKAEKYSTTSPYAYALNNPILFIDPDGNEVYCPSCKTDADWNLFNTYWDNMISMVGGNIYTGTNIPSNIQVKGSYTEDLKFRPTITVNGQVQDLPAIENRSRLDVFSEFFTPIIEIPAIVLTKSSWFSRNIVNPIKSLFSSEGKASKIAEPVTNTIYKRPNNAATSAQRASVQGEPCVSCGETAPKMAADHKTPLVKEHYQTGTIDKSKMKSVDAVQPQCPTCSAKQGAEMSKYSKEMKKIIEQRTNGQ
ncbi:RHS repeat domain-containing protein [Riemerella anatipestifer]|uniref:RHS repeat domain-containing protein n=1 Tax=Riemerella anatipestifer TaxID=34085 RepID=UPI0030ED1C6F